MDRTGHRGLRQLETGIAVITQPDNRWGRVDIKTTGLLPNVLAKQAAKQAGAFEAWLVSGDTVREGSSTNAWIVKDGRIITHPTGTAILHNLPADTHDVFVWHPGMAGASAALPA